MLNFNHHAFMGRYVFRITHKKISGLAMVLHEDYGALIPRMEELLAELDRLQLPLIAVHVDLALSNLKELVAGCAVGEKSDQN
jgi:hypothetical protein